MRPWFPGSWGLCALHVVRHRLCFPQEEEEAKVEEEAPEEVGARLPSYPGGPEASHPPGKDPLPP